MAEDHALASCFAVSIDRIVVAACGTRSAPPTRPPAPRRATSSDVYRYSRSLPDTQRQALQTLATRLRHDGGPPGITSSRRLRAYFQTIEPDTGAASTRHGQG